MTEPRRALASPDPTTDVVAADRAHLWHPFTQMQEWLAADPLVIAEAEGKYPNDADGRRYPDGVTSSWCKIPVSFK